MLIVDAQIHLWDKGTPSAHHRQEPYSAEQAITGMDAAGVDRALIHPDRFAIMGWFYLDDPQGRDLVAHWKERPGMLGLPLPRRVRAPARGRRPEIKDRGRPTRSSVGRSIG